jgi:hypothetical protein
VVEEIFEANSASPITGQVESREARKKSVAVRCRRETHSPQRDDTKQIHSDDADIDAGQCSSHGRFHAGSRMCFNPMRYVDQAADGRDRHGSCPSSG